MEGRLSRLQGSHTEGQGLSPQAHHREIPEPQREDPEPSPGQEAERLPWDQSPFTSDFPSATPTKSSQGKDASHHGGKTIVHALFLNSAKLSFVCENTVNIHGQGLGRLPHKYQSGHSFGRKA